MSVSAPILINTIDQDFYVESLDGPPSIATFLRNFPDTVYTKSVDSHLMTLMYALLGPSGVGIILQEYLESLIQNGNGNMTNADLDALYSGAFDLNRLSSESYLYDAGSQLLTAAQRAQILNADASFRCRARLWMQALHSGTSVQGISLAASSGLGQEVEAVENYKALVDPYTDVPLGLPYVGSSVSPHEIVITPRNNTPNNTVQTISFETAPTNQTATFTITVPIGPPYITTTMTTTASNIITVPDSASFPVGTWMNIDDQVFTIMETLSPTSIMISGTATSVTNGTVYIGKAETAPIPFNATSAQIESILASVPVINGHENVKCLGGPLPYTPVQIIFTGALASVPIGTLVVDTGADSITGSVGFTPASNAIITLGTAGLAADGLSIDFNQADLALMLEAVDSIRPQSTLISIRSGQSSYVRQTANSFYADQTSVPVRQFVTGTPSVAWPSPDGQTNWVEAQIEHEAPTLSNVYTGQYTNFHNILGAVAYNQGALNDPNYQNPSQSPHTPFWAPYADTQVGQFNQAQRLLYPVLNQYSDPSTTFNAQYAIASQPNKPQVTTVTDNLVALINDTYPVTYINLAGVNYNPTSPQLFWASDEMTTGTDYLELELGSVQAVNLIYFEATNKPYQITVAYDSIDQPPARSFTTASISNIMPSTTSLSFQASQSNPWSNVYLPIQTPSGSMIYTHLIRIGFQRVSQGEPFQSGKNLIPYSIEVRNLRIGRVVNTSGVSFTSTA